MSNPRKYNEFKISEFDYKKKKPISMNQTKRGTVSIHEHEADKMNSIANRTKLWYELAEERKTPERKPKEE